MNISLLSAGILSALAGLIHPVAGEYLIVRHLDGSHLRPTPFGDGDITRRILRGAWHFITLDFLLSAVILLALAFSCVPAGAREMSRFISLHFFGYALIIWIVAGHRFVHVLIHVPQWILLSAIAALAWWGGR
ncbi:MAG: hypothetical protein AB1714_31050 [Acidobacteriota bacterium]